MARGDDEEVYGKEVRADGEAQGMFRRSRRRLQQL